jgi:hypothetical protein
MKTAQRQSTTCLPLSQYRREVMILQEQQKSSEKNYRMVPLSDMNGKLVARRIDCPNGKKVAVFYSKRLAYRVLRELQGKLNE